MFVGWSIFEFGEISLEWDGKFECYKCVLFFGRLCDILLVFIFWKIMLCKRIIIVIVFLIVVRNGLYGIIMID